MFKTAADKSTISGNKKDIPALDDSRDIDVVQASELETHEKKEQKASSNSRSSRAVENSSKTSPLFEANGSVEKFLATKIVQRPGGRNISIYIDDDILIALDNLSEKLHTTRSKTICTLLRNDLFGEK